MERGHLCIVALSCAEHVSSVNERWLTVADPGFPVGGGVDLVGGGVDSRGGYVSKILYVKTKELGPLGGRTPGALP